MLTIPSSSQMLSWLGILTSLYNVKFLNKRIPIYCEWELTNYCNMDCPFCSTLTIDRNIALDISPEEALNIIDQLSEMGTKMIHFSGGEPTLRKDFPDLIARAKQNNITVAFTTNGSASIIKMEKLLDADVIRVSIDGTEEFHDTNRVYPGAYKKAVETLRFLVSQGKKPIITTICMDDTPIAMIEELALLARELRIKLSLNACGNNHEENTDGKDSRQKDQRFSKYISFVQQLQVSFGDVILSPEPFLTVVKQGGLDVFGCRAMDVAIAIKPDGSVCLPCQRFSKTEMKGNLREIFYGEKAEDLRKIQGKDPRCEGCGLRCMSLASSLLRFKGQISVAESHIRSIV